MTLRAVARGGGGTPPEPIEFPVTSVNTKTGAVVLNAADVGAATPAQVTTAQTTAQNNAKAYTDARYSAEARSLLESLDPDTATVADVINALLS